jgi:hypothetical protein
VETSKRSYFGTPQLVVPLSPGSKFNSPVCFDHSYTEIDELTHPFSALVYCQRFKNIICLANGLSENHRHSYRFLNLCFHEQTNYYSNFTVLVEMGI